MQKTLIYLIVSVAVLGLAGAAVFLFTSPKPAGNNTNTPGGTSYGGGASGTTQVTPGSSSPGATAPVITVAAATGGAITVKDFTKDPQTVTSKDIPGHYFISGGIEAYTNGALFSTFYVAKDQSFNISILKEPIADSRKLAEQELMQKLGISQASMCRLRYFISVPRDVNELYANKGNLGFSFCPGATQL